MKKVAFTLLICVFCFNCVAQWNKDGKRDLKLYTSFLANSFNILDFTNASSTQLPYVSSSTLQTMGIEENFSFINDTSGNLLFYTNGGYIYDSTYTMMQNGDSISPEYGGQSSSLNGVPELGQGCIILPRPNHDSLYYILHSSTLLSDTAAPYLNKFIYYSIVNMKKNMGKGAIISKNNLLLTDSLARGRMTACRHANGKDWWILIKNLDGNTFHSVLLDSMGIHLKPSFSVGQKFLIGSLSQACFSKLGNKYAVISMPDWGTAYLSIYNFNRCTGKLSNPIQLFPFMVDSFNYTTGICFSPNEQFLYASFGHYVIQYNLLNNKIDTVATKDTSLVPLQWRPYTEDFNFSNMQLGHDNRIYIQCANFNYMHYINQPDLSGTLCDVKQIAFQVPSSYGSIYINIPHFTTPPLTDKCDTSEGIGQNEIVWKNDWKIYPNPVEGLLNIGANNMESIEQISVLNVTGETVFLTKSISQIKVSQIPVGLYFLKIQLKDGSIINQRFIKQ
jgi:hypothetical protein